MNYHLIVHKGDVEFQAKDMNVSKDRRDLAKSALEVIENIPKDGKSEVLEILDKEHPVRSIPICLSPGDSVILYGGKHGACLSAVELALNSMDVRAEYHPKGFI